MKSWGSRVKLERDKASILKEFYMNTKRIFSMGWVSARFLGLLAFAAALTASAQPPAVSLLVERQGHTATVLQDGRVLLAGGETALGLTDQSEFYDPATQTLSLGPLALAPRADHTATWLADGRVLVIGGRDTNGPLGSTEIYDPAAPAVSAFSAGPDLNLARSGQSATLLQDGTVLVAGGDSAGTAEIYDPGTGQFTLLPAQLGTPRAFHGAALLNSGQVLLAGGSGGLTSAEVYSPATGAFTPAANGLATGRLRPTLRVLPDGKVQIIGGASDRTIEIYDPADNGFGAHAQVLIGSNTAGDVLNTQTRAALIYKGSTPALDPLLDRGHYSLTELPQRNEALVGGGLDSGNQILNSAYLLGSSQASVTTDKLDYAPFETVTFSGAGWQPGETVDMLLHEEPNTGPDIPLQVAADPQGRFTFNAFAPDQGDVGVTFTLTAWGQLSGFTAQTAFTDGHNVSPTSLSFSATAGGANPASQTFTFNGPTPCNGGSASASVTTPIAGTWLSVSPTSYADFTAANSVIFTVSVNISGLSAGSYSGSITVDDVATVSACAAPLTGC